MRTLLTSISLIAAAVACGAAQAKEKPVATVGVSASYRCVDGRDIEVLYGGARTAVLTIGDKIVELTRLDLTGSALYTGKDWSWLATGLRDGTLAAVGTKPVVCRAK